VGAEERLEKSSSSHFEWVGQIESINKNIQGSRIRARFLGLRKRRV